jgi:hypothetical protein
MVAMMSTKPSSWACGGVLSFAASDRCAHPVAQGISVNRVIPFGV